MDKKSRAECAPGAARKDRGVFHVFARPITFLFPRSTILRAALIGRIRGVQRDQNFVTNQVTLLSLPIR